MSFLLYIIALLVSGGALYFVATKLESKWEKGVWFAVLWIIGSAIALGLSYLLCSSFQSAVSSITNPTTATVVYFLIFTVVVALGVTGVFYTCKKLDDEKWGLQILLWYATAIVGTSLFLHIFRLISSLTVYVDTVGTVLMAVSGIVIATYWRNGENNGLQYYFGVVVAHILAVIMTSYLLWALGIATMDTMAATKVTMMPFVIFYAAYLTCASVLALKSKPLWRRWSYWLNWAWVSNIMVTCLITGILQLTGIITPYEIELVRYKNISESITYSTRVAMVFNTVRNGYTYPAARALLDAGTYTSPQAVSIEQSIDEHYQVYLTIPKPRLYFPRVYENNVGRVANWIILQSNKMYSDWQLGKKTNELQASAATYEKFGLLPEEADAIIQNTSSANLKDATQAAEFKMAAEAKNFYDNFMSASIDAEEASMAAIDISSPTTPIEVNKGEIKFGDPAPPNVITTFTSNKPFIVWERTGNDLLPIHLPAGTTQRYYAWAGKTKVEGIEDGTKIKISHLPK